MSATRLPILDLRRFDGDARSAFLDELRTAARTHGFFYLAGHGIDDRLLDEVVRLSKAFFALPASDKLAIQMVNSPHFRGYNRAGAEYTRGTPDWREQIDFGAERPAFADPHAPAWTRLQGPNQWPAALPALRPAILHFQDVAGRLAIRLLRAFAAALEQPEDVFTPIHAADPHFLMKVIRYPGRPAADSEQGVGAHKDSGILTLLLQDKVAGLQVEGEGEGGWIDAPPIPGTLVVNIGEILELASGGYLRATVHRVLSPPAGGERLSVAYFMGARLDASVPLLDLPPHLLVQARGLTQDPLNPLFRDVGRNYLKGRLRSHPDVAQRHHADLLEPEKTPQPEPAAAV